jgi:ABC-type lipopolysaccharide export system ATPase subunit
MSSPGMWRCVDLEKTDVSEERIASLFRVGKYANEKSVRRLLTVSTNIKQQYNARKRTKKQQSKHIIKAIIIIISVNTNKYRRAKCQNKRISISFKESYTLLNFKYVYI